MYFKLILRNVKRSFKDYFLYFVTLMFAVCIFYIFNSIGYQKVMINVSSATSGVYKALATMIKYVSWFIAVIFGFLVLYANNFLIKRRQKELGIYMTLGMKKGKISSTFIFETLIIGILSLVIGMILGIFLSQFMSILTAKMFAVNMTQFEFEFSTNALIRTIICFGIMFIVVSLFNALIITKDKLIDLIYGEKKNESMKIKNFAMSLIVLIISIALIVAGYILIVKVGIQNMDKKILIAMALVGVGTLLFFMSLASVLLTIVRKSKSIYNKGVNVFVARQVMNKINTNFITMTFTCLMLAVTIVTLSIGISFGNSMNSMVRDITPYDISIDYEVLSSENEEDVSNKLTQSIANIEDSVSEKNIAHVRYVDSFIYRDIYNAEKIKNNAKDILDLSPKVVSINEANALFRQAGKKEIVLGENNYLFVCNVDFLEDAVELMLKEQTAVNIFGNELKPAQTQHINTAISNLAVKNEIGTFIVPNYVVEGMKVDRFIANLTLLNELDEEKVVSSLNMNLGEGQFSIYAKQQIRHSLVGMSAMVNFLTIYIAIVFLLVSSVVLALQQTTQSVDNKKNYLVLSKMGVENKMLNGALLKQIAIYFITPLLLAIVHGIVGIIVGNKSIVILGGTSILPSILVAVIIFIVIYGIYFLTTYFLSKNIIFRK